MQWFQVSDVREVTFMLMQVMIHLGMQEIPAGNIVKRWTMDARDTVPVHLIENDRAAENSKSFRTPELFVVVMV